MGALFYSTDIVVMYAMGSNYPSKEVCVSGVCGSLESLARGAEIQILLYSLKWVYAYTKGYKEGQPTSHPLIAVSIQTNFREANKAPVCDRTSSDDSTGNWAKKLGQQSQVLSLPSDASDHTASSASPPLLRAFTIETLAVRLAQVSQKPVVDLFPEIKNVMDLVRRRERTCNNLALSLFFSPYSPGKLTDETKRRERGCQNRFRAKR